MIWLLALAAWFVAGLAVALVVGPVLRARDEQVDPTRPDPDRRLTFEQSMRLIEDRYGDAIEELGRS